MTVLGEEKCSPLLTEWVNKAILYTLLEYQTKWNKKIVRKCKVCCFVFVSKKKQQQKIIIKEQGKNQCLVVYQFDNKNNCC